MRVASSVLLSPRGCAWRMRRLARASSSRCASPAASACLRPAAAAARAVATSACTLALSPGFLHRRSRACAAAVRASSGDSAPPPPAGASATPGPSAKKPGGRGDRGSGSYPDHFLDLGPRIRKVSPADPDFDPRAWDIVCDVRSPSEWAEDHVPGSVSTPVLDDEQRAEVGTIYKQRSPFLAKKVGAAMVAGNLQRIIEEHFMRREKDARVLVYCWRGGERSLSLAHVLSRVGFQVGFVPGGYKAYRATVLDFLRTTDGFRYHVVAGKTGCAKGKMLAHLEAQGAQVLDLEAMAEHRGSVLGEEPASKFQQPSQKMFDTRLWEKARGFDRARPVFVEGESSMIGKVQIPKHTWAGMRRGSVTLLEVPMEARVAWIRAGYKHFETTEVDRLVEKLRVLTPKVGRAKVEEWERAVERREWDAFVEDILVCHYDAAYAQAAARSGRDDERAEHLMLPDTEDETYAEAAAALIRAHDRPRETSEDEGKEVDGAARSRGASETAGASARA